MAQFSGISSQSSDFYYKECTEFAATLVRPTPTHNDFASYFEDIDFSVCGPYHSMVCNWPVTVSPGHYPSQKK